MVAQKEETLEARAVSEIEMTIRAGVGAMAAALCAWAAGGQAPRFGADGVTRGERRARTVEAGALMTIYGEHLAEAGTRCEGARDGSPGAAGYPEELCGTRVLVGGKAAGMIYVSEGQVNFQAPGETPDSGVVEVRVVAGGVASAGVPMPAGAEKTELSIEGTAYTGMPVWLRVDPPAGRPWEIRYPYVLGPAGFGCNDVEVRRDGKAMPRQPGARWERHGIVFAGNICGSYGLREEPEKRVLNRLPLHLLYRFEEPGIYEVRLTLLGAPAGFAVQEEEGEATEWMRFEVHEAGAGQRAEWLRGVRARGLVRETEALTDLLPAVLGVADEESLGIVTAYLYHTSRSVRGFALKGLSYWPEEEVRRRLERMLKETGPSEEMVRFLGWTRKGSEGETARAAAPYLESDSPVVLAGAIRAAEWARGGDAAVREALMAAAGHVMEKGDEEDRAAFAMALAATKDERAHAMVRGFVESGREETLIALVSMGEAGDLPLVAAKLSDDGGGRWAFLAGYVMRSYGKAALPYLRNALAKATDAGARRELGRLSKAGE